MGLRFADQTASPELKEIVCSDKNIVVASDAALREARCGAGACGVLVDVVLRLVPVVSVVKSELELDMQDKGISKIIIESALSSNNFWMHWRLSSDSAGVAAATILCREVTIEKHAREYKGSRYNGRSWYPHGPLVSNVLEGSRKAVLGERKYTLQCSFSSEILGDVIAILKQLGNDFDSRVVELKFLKGSTLTDHAPNSTFEDNTGLFVALNVWWDLDSPELLSFLEGAFVQVPGMRLHKGKWFSTPMLRGSDSAPSSTLVPVDLEPVLSVLLPVYNALPWLPTALLDVLKQEVDGESVEVLAADDASRDGSLSYLVEVAIGLGERGSVEVVSSKLHGSHCLTPSEARDLVAQRASGGEVKSLNPALLMPSRDADLHVAQTRFCNGDFLQLSTTDVVARTAKRNRLRVLVSEEFINCGQGAAMTRCLRLSKAPYIGHMESDDARPEGAFQSMMYSLRRHPEWDGVTCQTKCIGWGLSGMSRYVDWQNSQDTPSKMR